MAKLSDAQLAGLAKTFWKNEAHAIVAVAIALAESSGNTDSHNSTPPDDSYGLWQINMYGSLGPARRAQYQMKANSELFNPYKNAAAAHAISGGGSNWCPWSVYEESCGRGHNGNYRKYVARARAAMPKATTTGLLIPGKGDGSDIGSFPGSGLAENVIDSANDSADTIADVATSIPDAINRLTEVFEFFTDPENWRVVLMVSLGFTLILIAALLVGIDLWSTDDNA